MSDEVVTLKEGAALLKLHPKTISRLIRRGQLPAQKIGRHWRMKPTVEALVRKSRV